MANGNPFYVQPMGDYSRQLSGLGQMIGDIGREKKTQARFQEVQGAMQNAWESQDPKKMAEVSAMYPEARESMEILFGFTNDQTKEAAKEAYRSALTDPENAEQYLTEGINRVSDAGGQPMNMLSDLGRVRKDPQEALKAMELGYASVASPQEWKAYQQQSGRGGVSKVGAQEILPDGTIIQSTSSGPRVYSPSGKTLTGSEAAEKIREAREYGVDIESRKAGGRRAAALESERELKPVVEGETTRAKEQAKLDVKDVNSALERAQGIREGLSTYDNMIAEIDAGASTSAYGRWGPAIKSSTRRFENEARKLGLGVIASTTFGALSAPELELAMETAVPKLEPKAMRQWLQNKKAAQEKLADELERYAIFRGDGGTKSQWMQIQKDMIAEKQASQAVSQEEQALQWARQNPNDPRAAAILQKLGVR